MLGRLDMWAAWEPTRNFVLFVEGIGEVGPARTEPGTLLSTRQFGVRYLPSDAFNLQVGGVPQIVGEFSSRSLSTRNPLIGIPDGYSLSYPYGARVDGNIGKFDYRAGIVDLPLFRPGYTPEPSRAWRPAIGGGVTPTTGMRVGVSAMRGPYLSSDLTPALLASKDWKTYQQGLLVFDGHFTRGYFETHAELGFNTYDVPNRATTINGKIWYVESKYTFTPRVFVAGRIERNDYPFISPRTATAWTANGSTFRDGEIGIGYRPTASTILKVSGRKDNWIPNPSPFAPKDNGYAIAVQWSQAFDVLDLTMQRK